MSDRIGGRIRTMRFADNYVDVGAQWVYGERNNIVFKMVKEMNVLDVTDSMHMKVDWIRSNGRKLPRTMVQKMLKVMRRIYKDCREELANREGTFGEFLVEKFSQVLSETEMACIDRGLAVEFLRTFKKMEGAAVDTDMSASGYQSYHPCQGAELLNWRDLGFKHFLQLLVNGDEMNEYGLLQGCIDLNTRVLKIEWDRIDGSVQISCEDSKKYMADHVVVTLSLGVLKKNTMLFEPLLPQSKRKAINFLGFAHICKIFVEFEEPFWADNWTGFNAIWRTDDLDQPQLEWLSDIYSFHPYAYQSRVLLGWAAGPYTEVIETIDAKLLTQGVMFMLRRFLPNQNIGQPKRMISSKWTIDPAHLGAYSYPSLLAKSYNTGPEQLAQPVNVLAYEPTNESMFSFMHLRPMSVRPILLFAGEATSPNHYSTVHGAVETGLREARRLSGYYQREL
ncbi:hypothetical protein KR222_011043 [Zaprionus bogoriensis]|nr:hypothetical protein KR222_011043 [Zaprionus bogoriensis]